MRRRPANRARIAWTIDLAEPLAGRDVLEVGLGPGVGLQRLLDVDVAHVVGVDRSPLMVATARRRLDPTGDDDRLRLIAADIAANPRGLGRFDRIVGCDVAATWADNRQVLSFLGSLLAPEGPSRTSGHRETTTAEDVPCCRA